MEQFLEGEEQTQDEFDEDLKKRSEDAIKAQFVLDLVAEQQELSVNDQELTEHIVRHAQRSGVSPDQFAQHVVENNLVPSLVSEVVRGKALAHLVENAKVTDASGNEVELKTLQPDGSYVERGETSRRHRRREPPPRSETERRQRRGEPTRIPLRSASARYEGASGPSLTAITG